jgi:hypothetical protein
MSVSSAKPGGSALRTISSASCSRSSSARVILSGIGEGRSTRRTTVFRLVERVLRRAGRGIFEAHGF